MDGTVADFDGLPIALAVDAAKRLHTAESLGFYVRQRGDGDRGLLVLYFEDGETLLIQERDFESNKLVWRAKAMNRMEALEHMDRIAQRDPDTWIIELDGRPEKNPFARLG